MSFNPSEFSSLLGKTLFKIEGAEVGSDEIRFHASDGTKYKQWHYQDCCERVFVEDVAGDVNDIIGEPILLADEVIHKDDNPSDTPFAGNGSWTWTFYKLATNKGFVTIRRYGSSNGYYSESVDFEQIA